jgi:phosphoserine phosphatase
MRISRAFLLSHWNRRVIIRTFSTYNTNSACILNGRRCANLSQSLSAFRQQRPPALYPMMMAPANRGSIVRCFVSIEGELLSKDTPSGPSGAEILKTFPRATVGRNVAEAMENLANADCVCFDVDSTVITEEGIDVLAEYLGKGPQVAELTKKAMEGGMKFQDALKARLELLMPTRNQIMDCIEKHPFQLSPHVLEFIRKLHLLGKDVYLVSGGFRIMIMPVAKKLDVAADRIVANQIKFLKDREGSYAGFKASEPTSQDMGKARALTMIQRSGYKKIVMIGDGATDAQAKPPAASFIGYGGIVARDAVVEKADWFVTDFRDLIYIIDNYSTPTNEDE